MNCPSCKSSIPAKHVFCGFCSERVAPVDPRVRQDVLSVLRERRKKFFAYCGLAITILGFWGFRTVPDVKNWLTTTINATVREVAAATREEVQATTQRALADERPRNREEVRAAVARQNLGEDVRLAVRGEVRGAVAGIRQEVRDELLLTRAQQTPLPGTPSSMGTSQSWSLGETRSIMPSAEDLVLRLSPANTWTSYPSSAPMMLGPSTPVNVIGCSDGITISGCAGKKDTFLLPIVTTDQTPPRLQ